MKSIHAAIVGIAALLAGPAIADHGGHGAGVAVHHYDSQVRIYPSHQGHNQGHFRQDRRGLRHKGYGYQPFSHRGNRRFVQQYRYYPRANPYRVVPARPLVQGFYRPGQFGWAGQGHHDHFHRNRPLLSVVTPIDRYTHCEIHGGYFLRDDLFYR